ncbi:MAG: hypothetical protein Q4F31_05300 [Eubacteriales bacterium]|nr:hypothetical protein [Eubacteriales bacterium]
MILDYSSDEKLYPDTLVNEESTAQDFVIPSFRSDGDGDSMEPPVTDSQGRVLSLYELDILQIMRKRMLALQAIIQGTEERINNAPEGTLSVKSYRGRENYYQTLPTGEKYLNKENEAVAVSLAQKGYDIKVKKYAESELKYLLSYFSGVNPGKIEDLYSSLPESRSSMVTPVTVTDSEYAEAWSAVSYPERGFDPEDDSSFFTSKGERVRSKSECLIADTLSQMGIPYRYECPVSLDGTVLHPDFTVLNVRTKEEFYWEHMGMMDSPEYVSAALRRIRKYEYCGLFPGRKLIVTQETRELPLDLQLICRIIEKYLK